MNCWEYKQCGIKEQCPAYPDGGMRCALVLGTLCEGRKQESYRDKVDLCGSCEYFRSEHHIRAIN